MSSQPGTWDVWELHTRPVEKGMRFVPVGNIRSLLYLLASEGTRNCFAGQRSAAERSVVLQIANTRTLRAQYKLTREEMADLTDAEQDALIAALPTEVRDIVLTHLYAAHELRVR